jgi:hypothetical protein
MTPILTVKNEKNVVTTDDDMFHMAGSNGRHRVCYDRTNETDLNKLLSFCRERQGFSDLTG